MASVKVTRREAAPIIAASFPGYRGRKIAVRFAERVTLYDVTWSGGTRNEYRVLSAERGVGRIWVGAPWDSRTPEGAVIPLDGSTIVVEHSEFCGSDMGLTIWAHPVLAPKLLN